MSVVPPPEPLRAAVQPLLNILQRAHGAGLRSVIVYGASDADGRRRGEPLEVLVVLADAAATTLAQTAPEVGQLRRRGLEPLFLAADELSRSLDVFPLEFLDMQADYVVIHGEDVLAPLRFEPAALRAQLEEDLRCAQHWLRQEIARLGHRGRPTRTILAQSFAGLRRVWRGLLAVRGLRPPAGVEAALEELVRLYDLPPEVIRRLRELELGTAQPTGEELRGLVGEYDRLLDRLIDLCDTMET